MPDDHEGNYTCSAEVTSGSPSSTTTYNDFINLDVNGELVVCLSLLSLKIQVSATFQFCVPDYTHSSHMESSYVHLYTCYMYTSGLIMM